MKLSELCQKVGLRPSGHPEIREKEVKGCYIGDLLSNVMAHAQSGDLWLTVQTHSNVVAVAVLLNLAGIVFVEGRQPDQETLVRAQAEGINLFCWSDSAYQLARSLAAAGIGSEPS